METAIDTIHVGRDIPVVEMVVQQRDTAGAAGPAAMKVRDREAEVGTVAPFHPSCFFGACGARALPATGLELAGSPQINFRISFSVLGQLTLPSATR